MITTQGKTVINNYFGGQTPLIAGAICLGVGSAAATPDDTALNFEIIRIPVSTTAADVANHRIIYKAVVPAGVVTSIYEIGLFHEATPDSGAYLSAFSAPGWSDNASVVTQNGRIKGSSLKVSAAAGATTTAWQNSVSYDLSMYGPTDTVSLAFFADTHLAGISVNIGSDQSNYYSWSFPGITAGYQVLKLSYAAGVKVGNPEMNKARAVGISALGGTSATDVYIDGFRFDQPINGDELVARTVLTSPVAANQYLPTEIEYSLGVSVA